YQVLDEDAESAVEFVDLSAEEDPRAAAESWMHAEMAQPTNLLGDRLYRIAWLRLGGALRLWYPRGQPLCLDRSGRQLGLAAAAPGLVIAATAAYVARMTGADDVVLGLAVTGRTTPLARETPTMMSNIVPLRVTVRPDMTIGDLVRSTSRATARALRHQRYRH